MIKCLAVLLLLAVSYLPVFSADSDKPTQYTATVTGVVCSACKAHITEAFKKLPGVGELAFAKGEKEGTQTVSFQATSDHLTKEDAVKALGAESSNYGVLELKKQP